MANMTPARFVKKWSRIQLKERTSAQSHFNDICELVGHKTPLEVDPKGEFFTFEAPAPLSSPHFEDQKLGEGRRGWADAWYKNKFIWEYKGPDKDLIKDLTGLGDLSGLEPTWPEAEVIIGNPPFLGGKRMRSELGDEYVDVLFELYENRVPHEADLVCYWFEKARAMIEAGKIARAGLLATQGIRGGANRKVLETV